MPPTPPGVARKWMVALGVFAGFVAVLWILAEANASSRDALGVFLLPAFALLIVGLSVSVNKKRGRRASGGGEAGWESDGGDTTEASDAGWSSSGGYDGGFNSDTSSSSDSGASSDSGGSGSDSGGGSGSES